MTFIFAPHPFNVAMFPLSPEFTKSRNVKCFYEMQLLPSDLLGKLSYISWNSVLFGYIPS